MKIKNWKRFQHFKDRKPVWIKVYTDLLNDLDWYKLDGDAAKLLVGLWLLASEDPDQNGELPDIETIAFRLKIPEAKVKQHVTKLDHWLYQDDINLISSRYQVDILETETEREIETEKRRARENKFRPPTLDEVSDYAKERRSQVSPQRFIDHYTSVGWKVGKNPMRDWRAAFRGWESRNSEGAAKPGEFGKGGI
jgi:hypothetical protein